MARLDRQHLPEPPVIKRSFQPEKPQVIGVSLLLLLVLFGALRVFGTTTNQVSFDGEQLHLAVTFPERTRLGQSGSIDVQVTNVSSELLEVVSVRFERAYYDAFSNSVFTPAVTRIQADAYEVELLAIPAGQAQTVSVEVQAGTPWRHEGFVEASADGRAIQVKIHSFVFP